MKYYAFAAVISALLSTAVQAEAPDGAAVISTDSFGSGCLAGSVTANVSEDRVLFNADNFLIESREEETRQLVGEDCNFTINVKVPNGFRVAMSSVSYEGDVYVPFGGKVILRASYPALGIPSVISQEKWLNTTSGETIDIDYFLQDEFEPLVINWSECGVNKIFEIDTVLSVRRGENEVTTASVLRVAANLIWEAC